MLFFLKKYSAQQITMQRLHKFLKRQNNKCINLCDVDKFSVLIGQYVDIQSKLCLLRLQLFSKTMIYVQYK